MTIVLVPFLWAIHVAKLFSLGMAAIAIIMLVAQGVVWANKEGMGR